MGWVRVQAKPSHDSQLFRAFDMGQVLLKCFTWTGSFDSHQNTVRHKQESYHFPDEKMERLRG